MERRNSKAISTSRIIDDESSLVKAAAWAWYEHGSSHESRQRMQEYDNVSSRKTKMSSPRPSRYKLEAMKQQVQENNEISQLSCLLHVQVDDPNSLLDSYEVGRISRDLDCYIKAKNCSNLSSESRSKGRKIGSFDVSCKNKEKGSNSKKDGKSGRGVGFMMRRSTMICRSRLDDVVDVRVRNGGSRWPEKQVAVVNVAACRPRRISSR